MTVAGVGAAIGASDIKAQTPVPNSAGTEAPKLKAPANACDCHMHIYNPRFPAPRPSARLQSDATVEHYRMLQKRIGTTPTVIVTPAAYGTDNHVTLDAIAKLGDARGVAVVHPDVCDADLKAMADGGVRGIRFTVFDPATAITKVEMIEQLAKRVADLGWHVQIHMRADQIVDAADLLQRLPSTIVFDHMGRLPQPMGTGHDAFAIIGRLLDKGRTWMKLSGAYMDTNAGPPAYTDKANIVQAYLKAAPERMLWGSDWPHPTEREKPNDAVLFDLMGEWAGDEAIRQRVLVANPAQLYGFPA